MKKGIIVLLFVAIMVLSMTGCAFAPDKVVEPTPAEVIGSGTLQYEVKGKYWTSDISSGSTVYTFGESNEEIAVYEIPGTFFLVGGNIEGNSISYAANIFIENAKFVALSDKYVLYTTGEGNGLVAVAIQPDANFSVDLVLEYSFEDLSGEEKAAFIYPVECKAVTK